MNQEEVQDASAAMFGNRHRLEVAASIARLAGKPITARAIEKESGLGYNRVQDQVARLRDLGLLIPDFDPEKRQKEYQPVGTFYWSACLTLLEDLTELEELTPPGGPR